MHGGKSPGAPVGKANPNYRGGGFTRGVFEVRRLARQLREGWKALDL
jgi:hypothetical protein